MIAVPVIWLVITRRNLASYGLSLRNLSYHLYVTATSFVPVAIASATLAFVDYRHWNGAIVLAGVKIAVLFAVGWLLKRKPTRNGRGFLVGTAILIPCLNLTSKATLDNAIPAFIFYVFFPGFGEELLFREYIQSRLNAVSGRPFKFYSVNLGWAVIIASALSGFMHVLNLGSLVSGDLIVVELLDIFWRSSFWFCTR